MNKELAFAKKLEEIRALAKEQGNVLSVEQVEEAFAEIEIGKEQLEPVYAYFKTSFASSPRRNSQKFSTRKMPYLNHLSSR